MFFTCKNSPSLYFTHLLSVALLALTFTQSVFAATTSIAYVTFMAHLKARYMASIFIGMGFSGLIPAFAALGQGQGNVRWVHVRSMASILNNVGGCARWLVSFFYTFLNN